MSNHEAMISMESAGRTWHSLCLLLLCWQVDCVYFDDDLVEIAEDPVSDVKDALSHCQLSGLEHACPQCFENQRRLVCAEPTPAIVTALHSKVG